LIVAISEGCGYFCRKSVEEKEKQIQEMIKEKEDIKTEKNKLENKCESIRYQFFNQIIVIIA
jgi:tRNA(Ile)-lysidine synthase TilS/MesJ